MIRMAFLLAMLLALPRAPALAWSGAPTPICANPDVLDVVADRLRARDPYAKLDHRSVSEAPDAAPGVVRCGVRVEILSYDARRAGMVPIVRIEDHLFAVRAAPGGFVLLSVR